MKLINKIKLKLERAKEINELDKLLKNKKVLNDVISIMTAWGIEI